MEKALVSLLNELVKNYVITLVLEEKKGVLLEEIDKKICIQEYKLASNGNVFLRKFKNAICRIKWAMKYYHKYDFSCNYATYSIIGSRLAQIASKNSSLYVHSDYYDLYKGNRTKVTGFFNSHNLENFCHIIFVSNESKNKISDIYPHMANRFNVINNLVPYKQIKTLASKEKIDFNKKYLNFLVVCRLENESKNFDLLIESFKRVSKYDKKYRLYIIGNGNYEESLRNLISKYKLDDIVIMLGKKVNPYPYIKECDFLISTSNYEGFPVTYQEALVLNKRFLTTIMVSDSEFDTRDYFVPLLRNEEDIFSKIISLKKEVIDYKIDFENVNRNRLNKFIDLIEVK